MFNEKDNEMTLNEVLGFLESYTPSKNKAEVKFLKDYRAAPDKEEFIELELLETAIDNGDELGGSAITFDVDEDPDLEETCPDVRVGREGFEPGSVFGPPFCLSRSPGRPDQNHLVGWPRGLLV